jgi:hypothetical protein
MQKAAACWFNRVAIWMWHMQKLKFLFCKDFPAMFDDTPKKLVFLMRTSGGRTRNGQADVDGH